MLSAELQAEMTRIALRDRAERAPGWRRLIAAGAGTVEE
jgi:hypothetical protein